MLVEHAVTPAAAAVLAESWSNPIAAATAIAPIRIERIPLLFINYSPCPGD